MIMPWCSIMHEVALCQGVIGLIEDAASRHAFTRVRAVVLEIGLLGHVAPEAMAFCFDAVSRGTRAEGARLVIERIAGAGTCPDCRQTVRMVDRFAACPQCGGRRVQLTQGEEMRVREMEVE